MYERLHFHQDPNKKILNAYLHGALLASRELLGDGGFAAVIKRAETYAPGMTAYLDERNWPAGDLDYQYPARHYSALFQAVEEVGGGRSQLVAIGIRTSEMGLAGLGPSMKAALAVMKRLPGYRWRVEAILSGMVQDMLDAAPEEKNLNAIFLETDETRKVFRYVDRTGDICHGRNGAKAPICHVYRGGFIGAIKSVTGRIPRVREVTCMAAGDPACTFEIDFEPEGSEEMPLEDGREDRESMPLASTSATTHAIR